MTQLIQDPPSDPDPGTVAWDRHPVNGAVFKHPTWSAFVRSLLLAQVMSNLEERNRRGRGTHLLKKASFPFRQTMESSGSPLKAGKAAGRPAARSARHKASAKNLNVNR